MRPDLKYIEDKFDYYNKLCFDGQLPRPPISLNMRRGSLGFTRTYTYLDRSGVLHQDYKIEISIRFDLPEYEYIDTIVHEMIHYYIRYNHIEDDSLHGRVFKAKMQEITQKYGIRITIALEESEEAAVMRVCDRYRYICVLDMEDEQYQCALVINNKLFELWNCYNKLEKVREVKWYASNRAIFEQFPVRVNPTFVPIEANKLHHYLTGAIELENTGTVIRKKEIICQ